MKRISCSIWSISGLASDGVALGLEDCLRFMPFLEFDEIPRQAGQNFAALLVHCNVVFDSDAADSFYVHPRLNGDDVPRLQPLRLPFGHARILVNFKPQSVAGAMNEIVAQPIARENPARRRIDFAACDSGPNSRDRSFLRLPNPLVPTANPLGRPSTKESAGYIATIVPEYSTQIQYDQLVFSQLLSRWTRMRKGAPLSKRHYGFKSWPRSSSSAHLVLNLSGQFPLRNAGFHEPCGALHYADRQARSFPHLREFLGVLFCAQAFHQARRVLPDLPGSCCLFRRFELSHRQVARVVADCAPCSLEKFTRRGHNCPMLEDDANPRSLLPGLHRETSIGNECGS